MLESVLGLLSGDHGWIAQLVTALIAAAMGEAIAPAVFILVSNVLRLPVVRQAVLGTAKIGAWISAKLLSFFGSLGEKIEDDAQIFALDYIIELNKQMDKDDTHRRLKITYEIVTGDSKKNESPVSS